ncbi:hypothetical protein I7I53_07520 [Histoplasma capsulatum var. duboisii H88]|uniref:Uncharacterized protein n=1 Tax=Ajellomyces capsulatus (strain H88) TaxID=544711 RepID=A0A8A1LJ58_AJEC8|nr:hypothetical protein I7I53_07520 [Histoplasma capsulatum var. duboisii H88]
MHAGAQVETTSMKRDTQNVESNGRVCACYLGVFIYFFVLFIFEMHTDYPYMCRFIIIPSRWLVCILVNRHGEAG